jgi:hypothetical protein
VNSNWDKVDAEAVAADGRLDVIEANNWVTTARITDKNVTAGKLADSLDLSGKTVSVAAPSADAHASTKKYVDDTVSAKVKAGVTSGTTAGDGTLTQALTGFSAAPVVTCGLVNPAAGTSGAFLAVVLSTTSSLVTFRVYNSVGSVVSGVSATVNWVAVKS